MSYPAWFEDLLDKIERAREKVIYGAAASSPGLRAAQLIESLRPIRDRRATKYEEQICSKVLFDSRENLKDVVAALERRGLPNESCQLKVLDAYQAAAFERGCGERGCGEPEPTLAEVRAHFVRQNNKSLSPQEFPLRKMVLNTFGLPLSKAKRGRPRIRNSAH